MRAAPLVSAVGVTKSYGSGRARMVALDDVTLEVAAGGLLLIRGRSGSGKTTLLHVLSGIAPAEAGQIVIDGEDLAGLDPRGRAVLRRRLMGFLFQRENLAPTLSLRENVRLGLRLRAGHAADASSVDEALARFGIAERASARPAQLSVGQRQLGAMARATVGEPRLVWADEPTAGLDSQSAHTVLGELRRLVDAGTTVVLVSHDDALQAYADDVVTLHDGRIT